MKLDGYDYIYMGCRDLGHSWFPWKWGNGSRAIKCGSCTTVRTDKIQNGVILTRTYKYPKGYHLNDVNRLDAAREARTILARLAKKHGIKYLQRHEQRAVR